MANPQHLQWLAEGVEAWNARRPLLTNMNLNGADFSGADLNEADLSGADLNWADLRGAHLREADLRGAYLYAADLGGAHLFRANLSAVQLNHANLSGAVLNQANLAGAHLGGAVLNGADLFKADLRRADFTADLGSTYLIQADLREADLRGADLRGADLSRADLTGANLYRANLSGAVLDQANLIAANVSGVDLTAARLIGANFSRADLTGARLVDAVLMGAVLVATDLRGADLRGASVYGISTWDLRLDQHTRQANLVITPAGQPDVSIDNLKLAQFVYLLLTNPEIRDVVDTLTTKTVLILGQFIDERKVVLDALRDALRQRGYVPILFDFEKPASRDLSETITTLAHLARFIIADLTHARSIGHELSQIVPNLPSVPVQPLILEGQREYALFEHWARYPWVLEPYAYFDQKALLAVLDKRVIAPAEAKAEELAPPKREGDRH